MQHRTDDDGADLQPYKPFPHTVTQQILGAANAVKAPAEDGSQGKQAQRSGDHHADPWAKNRAEGSIGKTDAHIKAIGDLHAADQNHQCSDGADHDGIQEHFHDAHHALLHRVTDRGGCVGDGGCAHTSLICKHAPGNAGANSNHGRTDYAPGNSLGLESAAKNGSKCGRNGIQALYQHQNSQEQVEACRKGNQPLRSQANALCAAKEHGAHQARHQNTHHKLAPNAHGKAKRSQGICRAVDDRVDLGSIAYAKGSNYAEKGIQRRKRPECLWQSPADHIHRSADPFSIGISRPVTHRQGGLSKFDHHAKQAAKPHPKNGPGPTDGNGAGHTGQIPRTYGCSQSRAHCLERGDPLPCAIPSQHPGKEGL